MRFARHCRLGPTRWGGEEEATCLKAICGCEEMLDFSRQNLINNHPKWEEVSMPKGKVTGRKAASSASKTLHSKSTGKKSKTAAGCALSQAKAQNKTTSNSAATAASKILRDKDTSKTSKSAAGSALSQKASKKAAPKKGTIYGGKKAAAERAAAKKTAAKRGTIYGGKKAAAK